MRAYIVISMSEGYYWMIIRKYETKYRKGNKFGTQDSETQYF